MLRASHTWHRQQRPLQNVEDGDEGHLRKVFNSLDLNGDGEITVDELQQVVTRPFSMRTCHVAATHYIVLMYFASRRYSKSQGSYLRVPMFFPTACFSYRGSEVPRACCCSPSF